MPNTRNQNIYNNLIEEINNSYGIFLFDFKGIPANEINTLRTNIKTTNAKIVISKNTLLKLALYNSKYKIKVNSNQLINNTAILFTDNNPVEAIKIIFKYIKDNNKADIKLGFAQSQELSPEKINQISSLPNLITLQTQFVSMLNNPIQRLVNLVNSPTQKIAIVLEEIRKHKNN